MYCATNQDNINQKANDYLKVIKKSNSKILAYIEPMPEAKTVGNKKVRNVVDKIHKITNEYLRRESNTYNFVEDLMSANQLTTNSLDYIMIYYQELLKKWNIKVKKYSKELNSMVDINSFTNKKVNIVKELTIDRTWVEGDADCYRCAYVLVSYTNSTSKTFTSVTIKATVFDTNGNKININTRSFFQEIRPGFTDTIKIPVEIKNKKFGKAKCKISSKNEKID